MIPEQLQLFWNALLRLFTAPNQEQGLGVLGPLEPLFLQYMQSTPRDLTTANSVVMGLWGTMLAVADALFVLLVILGVIQALLAESTGTLSLPLEELIPRLLTTALLMHLSAFLGDALLQFNNLLCSLLNSHLETFFQTVNGGSRITQVQSYLLYLVLLFLLNIGLIRWLLQAFERIVLWNLLFVLSPLAFLCTFLPATMPVFTFWGRFFVVVTLTQFLQLLAFTCALMLLLSAGISGNVFAQLCIAVAMLFLVAKIPDLIARFPSLVVPTHQGIGPLLGQVLLAARLLTL